VPFGGVAVKTAHFLQESADGVKSRIETEMRAGKAVSVAILDLAQF
jgi:hypothetical protein